MAVSKEHLSEKRKIAGSKGGNKTKERMLAIDPEWFAHTGSKGGKQTRDTQTAIDPLYYAHLADKANETIRKNGWKPRKPRGKNKQPRQSRGRDEDTNAQENTNR
jgi:general stress protein YciG